LKAIFTNLQTLLVCFCICCTCSHANATEPSDWTTPLSPFQISDNLYYVGSRDLAAFLIVTPAGHILINANLESSPPLIRASVEKLGFSWKDIKILLNGQAHSDHMGGAAEILRETSARNMVMDGDADVVRSGGKKDFAFGTDGIELYPPARVDRVLHNGDTVVLGGVTLTAHRTGGHTRGCTTWTFRTHISNDPEGKLRSVVIVGGWRALSQYRVVDKPGQPASYPGIKKDFYKTFAILRSLPCEIFLGAHGVYFDLLPKVNRMQIDGETAYIDPKGYLDAVNDAQANFDEFVAAQTNN
jgi:metallo-beta-lactamase class B